MSSRAWWAPVIRMAGVLAVASSFLTSTYSSFLSFFSGSASSSSWTNCTSFKSSRASSAAFSLADFSVSALAVSFLSESSVYTDVSEVK